jgi:hypothetical protein
MLARLLSHVVFWIVMAVMITGSAVVVTVGYVPYLVFRTVFLTVTGRLGDATGKAGNRATDHAKTA